MRSRVTGLLVRCGALLMRVLRPGRPARARQPRQPRPLRPRADRRPPRCPFPSGTSCEALGCLDGLDEPRAGADDGSQGGGDDDPHPRLRA